MKYDNESHIQDMAGVKQFFAHLVKERNLNIHPDDAFGMYANRETGEPAFTAAEVELYDRLMDECFEVCEERGEDVYGIAFKELQAWIKANRVSAA